MKAIDGTPAGYPGDSSKEWASAGGKTGTWLNLTWSSPQTLSSVRLYDRPNTSDNITGGTLTFSDGTTVTVPALDTAGAATTVTFTPRSTTTLRFTVTGVSAATANAGLAEIETYGYITPPPAPGPTPTNVAGGSDGDGEFAEHREWSDRGESHRRHPGRLPG